MYVLAGGCALIYITKVECLLAFTDILSEDIMRDVFVEEVSV